MRRYFLLLAFIIVSVLNYASADLAIDSSSQAIDCTLTERSRQQKERKDQHNSLPQLPVLEGTSNNWSGYAAATNLNRPAKNSVSQVEGVWVVPTLSCASDETYCSIWVGIDGYTNGTVEQIGTEHDCVDGEQQNYAWFEMYPDYAYEITGFPVNPDDVIGGEVSYVGNHTFRLTLVNYTQRVHTVIPKKYTKSKHAERKSAEWIVEAPWMDTVLPLSDFNTIAFTNCSTKINGKTGSINNRRWHSDGLTMETDDNIAKAVESELSLDGESFTVTWAHE